MKFKEFIKQLQDFNNTIEHPYFLIDPEPKEMWLDELVDQIGDLEMDSKEFSEYVIKHSITFEAQDHFEFKDKEGNICRNYHYLIFNRTWIDIDVTNNWHLGCEPQTIWYDQMDTWLERLKAIRSKEDYFIDID